MIRANRLRSLCALLLLSGLSHADFKLDEQSAGSFLKEYYRAVQTHDESKLTSMIAENAVIKLRFQKYPQQVFTLSRSDLLQQLRAGWHFTKRESYDVRDLNYKLTQAGLSGVLKGKVTAHQLLLDEKLEHTDSLEADLLVVDDQLQITGLRISSGL